MSLLQAVAMPLPVPVGFLGLALLAQACLVSAQSVEMFTALSDMARVVEVETALLSALRLYIENEESRLAELRQLRKRLGSRPASAVTRRAVSSALGYADVGDSPANDTHAWWEQPTSAFTAMTRLVHIRFALKEKILGPGESSVRRMLSGYKAYFPRKHDQYGATQAILRLQQTYNLSPADFALGKVGTHALPLAVMDCVAIASFAFDKDNYKKATLWLREALAQWKLQPVLEEDKPSKKVLTGLVFKLSFYEWKVGNATGAQQLTEHTLKLDANHSLAQQNAVFYSDYLARRGKEGPERESRTDDIHSDRQFRPVSYYYDDRHWSQEMMNYEVLCRSRHPQPAHVHAKLKCFYSTSNRNPRLLLKPAKVEAISLRPAVLLYRGIISNEEMEYLKQAARPLLSRAKIINKPGKNPYIDDVRISKSAWLGKEHDSRGILQRLDQRIEDITGLAMSTAEDYQVVNYGIGGQYEPHFDFARINEDLFTIHGPFGNRIATFLFYMADVEGGATVFTQNGIQITPSKGDASFWYNLLPSGERDYRTRHAGCPVLAGSKWVCNKWIHVVGQELQKPCGQNMADDWNIAAAARNRQFTQHR